MTKDNKRGFTIIEVVLVLAIAGLIFLMVFVALPALQRSQRNTQRREDLSRIMTALNDYSSNNSGKIPSEHAASRDYDKEREEAIKFIKRYVDESCEAKPRTDNERIYFDGCGEAFTDPDGTIYAWQIQGSTGDASAPYPSQDHVFHYYSKAKCGETEGITVNASSRNYAVVMILEGGSYACMDNS